MSFFMPPVPDSGEFELAPQGSTVAVCYRVIDLGTQQTNFGAKHQILISWELPDELMKDGRPFSIGKKYTYSSHEKSALRRDLESWRGMPFKNEEIENFDISKLIGAGCMIGIIHKETDRSTFANVDAILRLPRGVKPPSLRNEPVCLNLAERPFDHRSFGQLSERMQGLIKQSPEYDAAVAGRDPHEEPPPVNGEGDYGNYSDLNDQIPFVTASPSIELGFRKRAVL